jgi:hypothetical protein
MNRRLRPPIDPPRQTRLEILERREYLFSIGGGPKLETRIPLRIGRSEKPSSHAEHVSPSITLRIIPSEYQHRLRYASDTQLQVVALPFDPEKPRQNPL